MLRTTQQEDTATPESSVVRASPTLVVCEANVVPDIRTEEGRTQLRQMLFAEEERVQAQEADQRAHDQAEFQATMCGAAFMEYTRSVTALASPWLFVTPLPRAVYVPECLRLPEATRQCLLEDYRRTHEEQCVERLGNAAVPLFQLRAEGPRR